MSWKKVTIDSGGVRLCVFDSGGPERPVLLIHGLGLTRRSWNRVARRLRNRFRVVTFDLRGHGASSRAADVSPPAFLGDVEAVVSALALQDVVLVGHSLGGHLAVAYAADHAGCAGVVAVEGGVPVDLPPADPALMAPPGPVASVVAAVSRLLRLGSSIPYERMQRLVDEHAGWVRGLGDAYDRITCPVLVVLGAEADPVPQGVEIRDAVRDGARRLQAAHPEVAVEWLSGGHLIPLQRPAELAAAIGSFVDRAS